MSYEILQFSTLVALTDSALWNVGVLHRDKGMAYQFLPGQSQPWSWRQMLASFKPDVRRQILGDDDDGLVSISCEAWPGSYDHKRHHAAKAAGQPYDAGAKVPVWDFVVHRASGACVRFHPHQTSKKVDIASINNPPTSQHPRAGRGNSDGPGTYRACARAAYPSVPLSAVAEEGADHAQHVFRPSAAAANPAAHTASTVVESSAPPGLYYVRDRTQPAQSGGGSSSVGGQSSQWANQPAEGWREWEGWNKWEGWGGPEKK